MEQVNLENKSLSFREKKNRIGRLFLYLGFFISIFFTGFVIFLMIISSLGISPSDQYGFKGVSVGVGDDIASTFLQNKINLSKGEYTLKFDEKTNYSFTFEDLEDTKSVKSSNIKYSYSVEVDVLKKAFYKNGNSSEISTIGHYEDALTFVEDKVYEFKNTYAYYDSSYYKSIYKSESKRYFYNEEKKLLKVTTNNIDYLIINSNGVIKEGRINLRDKNDPLIYTFSFTY